MQRVYIVKLRDWKLWILELLRFKAFSHFKLFPMRWPTASRFLTIFLRQLLPYNFSSPWLGCRVSWLNSSISFFIWTFWFFGCRCSCRGSCWSWNYFCVCLSVGFHRVVFYFEHFLQEQLRIFTNEAGFLVASWRTNNKRTNNKFLWAQKPH